jgi:hypothetical protein
VVLAGVGLLAGAALLLAAEQEAEVSDAGPAATIPLGNLDHACPLDCIPSIDEPDFVSSSAGRVREAETVIGLARDGVAKAYPLSRFGEVVNDEIAGTPVVITWCPLCGTPIAFERRIDGEAVEFGVSGKLHNNDLVLYDRESFTLWQQITGEGIVGPRAGEKLTLVPTDMVTYGEWEQRHPDTLVLTGGRHSGSGVQELPYEEHLHGNQPREVSRPDRRLESFAVVYGVEAGEESAAFPLSVIREEGLIEEVVGDVPVLVLDIPDTTFVRILSVPPELHGSSFSRRGEEIADASGRRWSADGTALSDSTPDLGVLPAVRSYWFGWSAFHPDTSVVR